MVVFNLRALFVSVLFLAVSASASAEVLFEGYSKVLLDGTHVGYIVQRYEFDAKKKEFSTAYFLKTNQTAGNITESLTARANATLKPISYHFTELIGTKPRTIDAEFVGDNMTAKITAEGKQQTLKSKVPKTAFLASFLGYMLLQGKEGIKTGVKYAYQAIAEEDTKVYSGEAYIAGEESVGGINAFKILNTFKGTQFISFCTFKAEVLGTRSPLQKLTTELVATLQEATVGQSINNATITRLFGSFPKGTENPVARRALAKPESAPAAATATPEAASENTPPPPSKSPVSPKLEGIPGGKGIIIKGQPPTPEEPTKEGN